MKTFFNILQTLINKKYKIYPDEPNTFFLFLDIDKNKDKKFLQDDIYINTFISNIYYKEKNINFNECYYRYAKSKFMALNDILFNPFFIKEIKDRIFYLFSKAQKCYHAFLRLAHIYKFKKYKIVVKDDLSLNPIDPQNNDSYILIQNKSKFFFRINDLISIIETSICNSPNFFSHAFWPENPYNKIKFSPSNLYNIYFKMKDSGRLISTLFHFFFLENFQLSNFVEKYESFIRDKNIESYVLNSPFTMLYSAVLTMINNNKYTRLLNIHKDFPKETLVEIFRPFLYYYYIYNYGIKGSSKIYKYKLILFEKLKNFYEYNKAFGRKCIQLSRDRNLKLIKKTSFNSDHINFYKIHIKCMDSLEEEFLFFNNNSQLNRFFNDRIFMNHDLNNYNSFDRYYEYLLDSDEDSSEDNEMTITPEINNNYIESDDDSIS
uniref:Uncharacterized protein n=1 Tax=viral metagenome TaxID=1070528 RepID=A0A6C0KRQ5_9ZZZZ